MQGVTSSLSKEKWEINCMEEFEETFVSFD